MAATTKTQGTSKKQLYFVIGGAVVLALILVLQLPKLMGGGSETASPTTTDALPTAGTTGAPGTSGGTVNASGSGAVLAGVKIVPGVEVEPGEGQLASFSLFQNRDPFVQLVKDTGAAGSQDGEPVGVKVSGGGGAGGPKASNGTGGPIVSGGTPGNVEVQSQLTTATIWVNGSDESVAVKKKFPKTDPTFVLLSLKPKAAQLAVAGGAFTGSAAITLKMGQPLTLVNTATGARYTLRLLYTGSQPEQVQQFTTQAQN